MPPGAVGDQVQLPINTYPPLMGLGAGAIYLPTPGIYQPKLIGKIDGVDAGPWDCGPAITVTEAPILKLIGNDSMPAAGAMPPGTNSDYGTLAYFTMSKFVVAKTGLISQWRLWMPGNNKNAGGSYALAVYADNHGPYGAPIGAWNSWGQGAGALWAPMI